MSTSQLLLAGALCSLVLSACDAEEGPIAVSSEIVARPPGGTPLEFGTFVLQRTRELPPQIVELENVGNLTVRLTSVEIDGVDNSQYRVTQVPRRIIPGEVGLVYVRFEPEFHGEPEAELVIRTDDVDNPEFRYPLVGVARDPCQMSVRPNSLGFALGETRSVQLVSRSSSPCVLTTLDTKSPYFVVEDAPEMPFEVPAQQTAELSITHVDQPLQAGVPTANLVAIEDDGGRETVLLTGEPRLFGCLEVLPNDNIRFLNTPIGEFTDEQIRIRNTCIEPIAIRAITIPFGPEEFSLVDPAQNDGFDVPALSDVFVGLRFTPIRIQGSEGRLVIFTEDVAQLRYDLDLAGFGEPAVANVFPTRLDFGEVTYRNPVGAVQRSECSSATQDVVVFSQGASDLLVTGIELEEGSDDLFLINGVFLENDETSTVVANPNDPITVPNNFNLRIRLTFFPTSLSDPEHEGVLRVSHNGQDGFDRVRLFGRSTADVPVLDEFQQSPGPEVDILWVIDDSCSMLDEQLRLIQNLEGFTRFADDQVADYQMAVTVTEGRSDTSGTFERCFPHPPVIPSSYAQRAEAFRCTFDVGTAGSFIEAGLAAAKNALLKAQSDAPGPNRGFLREDADLAVVIMSDEDDGSIEPIRLFREFFDTVKGPGREDQVKVHGIVGPIDGSCRNEMGFFRAQPGFAYNAVVEHTGGTLFNICLDDWTPVFDQLGLDTFQPRDTWFLSKVPDPDTLRVFVDGAEVAAGSSGFTYSFAGRSITFGGDSVPGPGARIEAQYSDLCAP